MVRCTKMLLGFLLLASTMPMLAQYAAVGTIPRGTLSDFAQVVALDECDPTTFNAALGADFCHNVTLGAFTTLSDLFAKAASGHPDPGWDFEPDVVNVQAGGGLPVVGQGGGPHTV